MFVFLFLYWCLLFPLLCTIHVNSSSLTASTNFPVLLKPSTNGLVWPSQPGTGVVWLPHGVICLQASRVNNLNCLDTCTVCVWLLTCVLKQIGAKLSDKLAGCIVKSQRCSRCVKGFRRLIAVRVLPMCDNLEILKYILWFGVVATIPHFKNYPALCYAWNSCENGICGLIYICLHQKDRLEESK